MTGDPGAEEQDLGLEGFVREVALSVSVHRDRSPAMVWPEHEPVALLRRLALLATARLEPLSGPWWNVLPAGPEAAPLADRLQAVLGRAVRADYASGPFRRDSGALHKGAEALLFPLRGSFDCTVLAPSTRAGEAPALSTAPLHLRVRPAEVLYVPARSGLSVSGGAAASVLLVLSLSEAGSGCRAAR